MGNKIFIPITDEILYEHPELITAPLRPYRSDDPCFHWMATIEPEIPDGTAPRKFDHNTTLKTEPISRPMVCAA